MHKNETAALFTHEVMIERSSNNQLNVDAVLQTIISIQHVDKNYWATLLKSLKSDIFSPLQQASLWNIVPLRYSTTSRSIRSFMPWVPTAACKPYTTKGQVERCGDSNTALLSSVLWSDKSQLSSCQPGESHYLPERTVPTVKLCRRGIVLRCVSGVGLGPSARNALVYPEIMDNSNYMGSVWGIFWMTGKQFPQTLQNLPGAVLAGRHHCCIFTVLHSE